MNFTIILTIYIDAYSKNVASIAATIYFTSQRRDKYGNSAMRAEVEGAG